MKPKKIVHYHQARKGEMKPKHIVDNHKASTNGMKPKPIVITSKPEKGSLSLITLLTTTDCRIIGQRLL